ncbi:MAG: c-type cytochrome [Flavicella sp.]
MKSVKKHSQVLKAALITFSLSLFFALNISAQGDVKAGKSLFNSNCAACHKLDKKLVGPALGKISERREMEWLKLWIKDNAALRASGDADAIAIFEEYNGAAMSAFPQLSDADIVNIVAYLDADPVKKVAAAVQMVDEVEEEASTDWISYVVLLVLAGLVVWIFTKSNNTFLKIVAVIFLLLNIAYFGFTALLGVGVDEGYQPVQPIAFSHRIHAGDNKIECQYCHSAAKHSKSSGIPSVNICMNCHKNIAEVSEETATAEHSKAFYDAEIQKVYKAAGWDPEKLEYTGEEEPIKWVRIHNLPDFAYYNHAQHVTVGGIKCQQCHGPVEEMEELYQYSPLTMGWCIDCHKETKVKMEGNGYYKNIHEELSKKYGVDKVTAAQMGGKECGKCHY